MTPTTDDFAGEFDLLSMARLRIDIEHALQEVLEQRGVSPTWRLAVTSMVPLLEELKLMPITEEFTASLHILSSAVHGQSAETEAIQQACCAARKFLVELQKLIKKRSTND